MEPFINHTVREGETEEDEGSGKYRKKGTRYQELKGRDPLETDIEKFTGMEENKNCHRLI